MTNVTSDRNTSADNADLQDSKQDQEKLKQEIVIIDMPEVQDIPGQENVRVPDLREMQDTTISSADEEAEELLSEINTGPGSVNDLRQANATNNISQGAYNNTQEATRANGEGQVNKAEEIAGADDRDNNEELSIQDEESRRQA